MIKRSFSLMLVSLFLVGTVASLAGCNTVEGAGKDMQQGGKAISKEADKAK
jgi:entericidin B